MKPSDKHIPEKFCKKNPFVVPDNYFDELHAQVMKSIPTHEIAPSKTQRWQLRRITSWSVAAIIALGLSVGVGYKYLPVWNNTLSEENKLSFASTDDKDFYLFLQDDVTKKEFLSNDFYN